MTDAQRLDRPAPPGDPGTAGEGPDHHDTDPPPGTDPAPGEPDAHETRIPSLTPKSWPPIARSAGGQVLAAAMIGLRNVLEDPKDDQVAVVVDAPGEPVDPDADFVLELDFEHPERSRVVLRDPPPPG